MLKSSKFLYTLNFLLLTIAVVLVYLIINEIALRQDMTIRTGSVQPSSVPAVTQKSQEADLSYILVTVDNENAEIEITDSDGSRVGESFVEGPLAQIPNGELLGEALKTSYVEKPSTDGYEVKIVSESATYVDVYLYDIDGKSVVKSLEKEAGESILKIEFDKENASSSVIE